VKRREFITLLGGTVAAWPLAARAQQSNQMRRIGVLMPYAENDPQVQARYAAFLRGLQQLGWIVGKNLQIDYRWSAGIEDDTRKYVAELVALAPDVIFASGSAALGPLRRATRTVPIVFVLVPDPVGSGFVDSLARPGGNITGFTPWDYGLGAKWLELLKQIAPTVTRVAVVRDPAIAAWLGMWGAIQSVSASIGLELRPVDVRDPGEIERALAAFAASPNCGLILTGSALAVVHRDLIITLAARHRLPAVYYDRYFAAAGGLISYGSDTVAQYSLAAGYVDRILRGEKPADLPVQAPTKYELVINLKTAKALGLDVPPTLSARAEGPTPKTSLGLPFCAANTEQPTTQTWVSLILKARIKAC
jgi:putative ABC transport system substrate-binding protein